MNEMNQSMRCRNYVDIEKAFVDTFFLTFSLAFIDNTFVYYVLCMNEQCMNEQYRLQYIDCVG